MARISDRWRQNADGSYTRYVEPPASAKPDASVAEVEEVEDQEVDATEGALALAEEHGIDLSSIEGSGKDGRITKADVEAAVA